MAVRLWNLLLITTARECCTNQAYKKISLFGYIKTVCDPNITGQAHWIQLLTCLPKFDTSNDATIICVVDFLNYKHIPYPLFFYNITISKMFADVYVNSMVLQ
ncbi:hypothetical protein BD560DRAFT_427552 [Blakeslea trispora]|nr:hypothetical protein BD560DRAFT_427552 [Blakeslea trispora]